MDEHDRILDLVARMLTCATYITSLNDPGDLACRDACSLLIEAAAALERLAPPPDLGKPMDVIEPPPPKANGTTKWHDPGRQVREQLHQEQRDRFGSAAHPCPKCDSRAMKTVKRDGGKLTLICPVCSASWDWMPAGEARWY